MSDRSLDHHAIIAKLTHEAERCEEMNASRDFFVVQFPNLSVKDVRDALGLIDYWQNRTLNAGEALNTIGEAFGPIAEGIQALEDVLNAAKLEPADRSSIVKTFAVLTNQMNALGDKLEALAGKL